MAGYDDDQLAAMRMEDDGCPNFSGESAASDAARASRQLSSSNRKGEAMNSRKWLRSFSLCLILLLVPAGILAAVILSNNNDEPRVDPVRTQAWETTVRDKTSILVEQRLTEADQEADAALERHLQILAAFFQERGKGTLPFAQALLGLSGKWAYLQSHLPGCDDDAHSRYVQEQFDRCLFTNEDVKQAIESTAASYLTELTGIESRMLVLLRADIAACDPQAEKIFPDIRSDQAFLEAYGRVAQSALARVAQNTQLSLARETVVFAALASPLASRVIGALGARIVASAGVLGLSVSSTVGNLAAGFVIAVIIDKIIDTIMHAVGYDAEESLRVRVQQILDEVQANLVDGIPEARETYAQLCNLRDTDPDPEVRVACAEAAGAVERGGALGLKRELRELTKARRAACTQALQQWIAGRQTSLELTSLEKPQ
jgi:hypothetical protein